MNSILCFDHLNDILFSKYNKEFSNYITEYGSTNGLLFEVFGNTNITKNILVQLFSPLVTSHRIMSCRFGNSYSCLQCSDNLNVVFEEYMGYLFISLGKSSVDHMRKYLSTSIIIIRFFCGPDLSQLKNNTELVELISSVMDTWSTLNESEQSVFLEAIEQLAINTELRAVSVQVVKQVIDGMLQLTACSKIHALLLVQNHFLTLYSSANATELSATDIMFLILFNATKRANKMNSLSESESTESDSDEQFHSTKSSPQEYNSPRCDNIDNVSHHLILLTGNQKTPQCIPHDIHISPVADGVSLVVLVETGDRNISSCLYKVFSALHSIQLVQLQRDRDILKPAYECLDVEMRHLCDLLRRVKDNYVECCYKQLMRKWEFMRKKYFDFLKTNKGDALLRAESCTMDILETLRQILNLTSLKRTTLDNNKKIIADITRNVKQQLSPYEHFLNVKSLQNCSLGSDSLTINKYLEEFPGLVHFMFIDRSSHRITTPSLQSTQSESNIVTKNKIWSMVTLSRTHLQQGHLSLLWKDTTFNYAYFLWFEDSSGSSLKPNVFPTRVIKPLPHPGIMESDYYRKLKETCFPKMQPSKVRCYEIYCIHLGLVTAPCVLEHARRLAATIWDIHGHSNHPMDIL